MGVIGPLEAADPSRIGGHRLLGRLGAGGMGVVYLGRTGAGALAAVKVIRPECAEEPGYRERFRREAAAARRVRGPHLVRVTGSDPDAEPPWLATEFVPGLSLAEAVAGYGPLPVRTVRALAGALARALAVVHAAGLVHRDVKPANVLLSVTGPRLIDFGIARAGDATALTATGVLVGTPGYLPPEQALGGRSGPAGDVFALGCLLVYAATGRPPFGTGPAPALLFRTVHDEPDVSWAALGDAELAGLLRGCLAKEPADRPPAAALATALTGPPEPGPRSAGGAAGTVPGPGPGTAVASGPAEPAVVAGAGPEWLPDALVAAVAARATELLSLPEIEATLVVDLARPRPGRRRFLALAAGASALAAGGTAAAWLGLHGDRPAPPPPARRWVIGVQADLSGPRADLGRAQERGVRLAVEEVNSRTTQGFRLSVTVADDAGDPARAPAAADRLAGDPDVLAVLGPTADACALTCLDRYARSGLPLVTVSAAGSAFGAADRRALLQSCPVAAAHAGAVNRQLVGAEGVRRLAVLCDRSGGSPAWETAFLVDLTVGYYRSAAEAFPRVVPRGASGGLAPVVTDLLARRPDGLLYTGTPAGAAEAARLVAAAGFRGPRAADYPCMGPEFLRAAGPAAAGWQFLAPCIGPGAPPVAALAAAHRRRYGTDPAPWTAEAYDATLLVADRLARLAAGGRRPARAELLAGLRGGTYRGLLKEYAFDGSGRIRSTVSYLYRVEGGRIRYAGPAPQRPGG
ncbi:bifunctional serine/threonine-protein kinase/ABC transporter substrate-binding protein [Streptomyces sp. NPDC089919]|uniref:bifunctional serine/threonine-protein kinase/ABC transporter substrate-binding protein n=1 Tax=Streptomyces sp. NPDC089919 TaxID=3155188 RepID=UPI0034318BBE